MDKQVSDDRLSFMLCLLLWLVLTGAAVYLVVQFGPDVPLRDDWVLSEHLGGAQPLSLDWLWSRHNEHRLPLPRLVLLGLYWIAGYDFRAGMFGSVVLLSLLSLASLAWTRYLRGRADLADTFIPLLFLNWGHCENLLWSFQVCFALSTILLVLAIYLLFTPTPFLTHRRGWTLGGTAVALILCGGSGIATVPPILLWLLFAAWRQRSAMLALAPSPAILLAILYFIPEDATAPLPPQTRNAGDIFRTTLEVFGMMFGEPGRQGYPYVGAIGIGFALLAAWGFALGKGGPGLARTGAAASWFSCLLLALAVGWGRAGMGGLNSRYALLVCPILLVLYLVAVRGDFGSRSLVIQRVLAAILLACTPINLVVGHAYGDLQYHCFQSFVDKAKRGSPRWLLAQRYAHSSPSLFPDDTELAARIDHLRQGRVRFFADIPESADWREVTLKLTPNETRGVTWKEGIGKAVGDARLIYSLPKPLDVAGIRLRARLPEHARFVHLQWKSTHGMPSQPYQQINMKWNEEREAVVLPVDERVTEFALSLPEGEFALSELTLLCWE